MHILISRNNESFESELKKVGDKIQYENELIPHNDLSDTR